MDEKDVLNKIKNITKEIFDYMSYSRRQKLLYRLQIASRSGDVDAFLNMLEHSLITINNHLCERKKRLLIDLINMKNIQTDKMVLHSIILGILGSKNPEIEGGEVNE